MSFLIYYQNNQANLYLIQHAHASQVHPKYMYIRFKHCFFLSCWLKRLLEYDRLQNGIDSDFIDFEFLMIMNLIYKLAMCVWFVDW
jgi:hypothetical protein